ncbi:MAG: DNA polymerase III subunit delta [Chloroflexi bacterium]|nr:DNA polymerase III subunit delta [Chloroflexota bacterium]
MYYIFHGDNELARTEQLKALRNKMGADEFAALNTTHLDGKALRLGELQYACDAVPFLGDKRLVIVENFLARFDPRPKKDAEASGAAEEANPNLAKDLKEYLTRLPATTRLVFVESKKLFANNPILKHANATGRPTAIVSEFSAPSEKELPAWIRERVQAKGGTIEPDAVRELAAYVGTDLRLLDNEIEKLLTYRGKGAVRAEDVRLLVAAVRESNIFDLMDAIGHKETSKALKLLHAQLDHKADERALLGMFVRQVRLLLSMRDYAARGMTLERANAQLKLHPFAAGKAWEQALNFSPAQLAAMYHQLLETDLAIKTSQSEPIVALDTLIVEMTRG